MAFIPKTAPEFVEKVSSGSVSLNGYDETYGHWLSRGVKDCASAASYMVATLPYIAVKNGLWDYVIYPMVDEIGYRLGNVERTAKVAIEQKKQLQKELAELETHYAQYIAELEDKLASGKKELNEQYSKECEVAELRFEADKGAEKAKGRKTWSVEDSYKKACESREQYHKACHGNLEIDFTLAYESETEAYKAKKEVLEQGIKQLSERLVKRQTRACDDVRAIDEVEKPSQLKVQELELEDLNKQHKQLTREYEDTKRECERLKEQLDTKGRAYERLNGSFNELEKKKSALEESETTLKNTVRRKDLEIGDLKAALHRANQKQEGVYKQLDGVYRELEAASKNNNAQCVNDLLKKRAELDSELKASQEARRLLEQQLDKVTQSRGQLEQQSRQTIADLQARLKASEQSRTDRERDSQQAARKQEEHFVNVSRKNADILQETTSDLEQVRKEKAELEARLEQVENANRGLAEQVKQYSAKHGQAYAMLGKRAPISWPQLKVILSSAFHGKSMPQLTREQVEALEQYLK